MKVELRASALFTFDVSYGLVTALIDASRLHYDGECQRLSSRIGHIHPGYRGRAPQNGLLTCWLDRFSDNPQIDETVQVTVTWRELDLISKVASYYVPGETARIVILFGDQIRSMFDVAGPKIMAHWKHDFEV